MIEKFSHMKLLAERNNLNLINLDILAVKVEGQDPNTLLNDIGIEDYKSVGIGVNLQPKIFKGDSRSIIYLHNMGDLEDIASPSGITYYEKLINDIIKSYTPKETLIYSAIESKDLSEDDEDAFKAIESAMKGESKPNKKEDKEVKSKGSASMPSDEELLEVMQSNMEELNMIMLGSIYDKYKNVNKDELRKKLIELGKKNTEWEVNEDSDIIFLK